ncbi:piggyBac transposable element-derived protein 4-like [Aplysia californica]|uniref:PiggyBac transposable element-derived protein 4-like n=1 Tax=Aplysia californica TaxID=6500 RepID=A0ABM0JM67_APLCA|nr:piggyBac transposable element-derived protein 4-like [Aplysia californica]
MVPVRTRTADTIKPAAVRDYTQNMGGVDHSVQMISYHPLHRKTVKYWEKLAFHLMTLVMVQSHILYNEHRRSHRKKTMQLQKFVMSVCRSLASIPEDQQAPPQPHDLNRLVERHFPSPIVVDDKKMQRACVVCYARAISGGDNHKTQKSKRKVTQFECSKCNKALCVHPCFEIFHTKEHYA